jgi:hypothetical protein
MKWPGGGWSRPGHNRQHSGARTLLGRLDAARNAGSPFHTPRRSARSSFDRSDDPHQSGKRPGIGARVN